VYVDLHLLTNPDHKLLFVAKLSVCAYGVLSTLMMPVIIAVVGKEEEKFPNV